MSDFWHRLNAKINNNKKWEENDHMYQMNGRKAWTIAFMLFLAQLINYFDKSVIGLAATSIMEELKLTPEQYGLVASSFFSLYAVSGVLTGFFLAGRVRSKTLLIVLVLIWSLSQLPVLFFSSLAVLVICRVILGIGEGPANPAAISACHEWFSSENRNMPTALLMLGSSVGSLLAGPTLSWVIVAYGWRAAFLVCSVMGLVWIALWMVFGADGPGAVRRVIGAAKAVVDGPAATAGRSIRQIDIWCDPTILASIVVGFCAYWVVGFSVAWVAPLIRTGLGYDAQTTGWIVSAVSGLGSITLLSVSFLSERMLKGGASSRIARAGVNSVCMLLGGAAFMAAAMAPDPMAKLVLMAVGAAFPVLTFTLGPALVSEVTPAEHRSRMLIMIYAGITIAGFVSPLVAGHLIAAGGEAGYDHALVSNALVVLAGGVVGLLFLRPERTRARFEALATA